MNRPPRSALGGIGAALALTLGACGSDEPEPPVASGASTAPSSAAAPSATEPASDGPFGDGCAAFPAEGEGSLAGMADDPVATAVGKNPLLSRLADAVAAADLGAALDGVDGVTVLAPADAAFDAVPAEVLEAVLGDTPRLTALLTHHVLEGRLAPGDLAGPQTTLNGHTVTVEGSGEGLGVGPEGTVVGESPARVVCGNVQTANATVYVIDQVLAPPAA